MGILKYQKELLKEKVEISFIGTIFQSITVYAFFYILWLLYQ